MKEKILRKLEKPLDLEAIEKHIPLIQHLDVSFGKSPGFLLWQILRLNRDYQSYCLDVWRNAQLRGITNCFNFFGLDYPPLEGETFLQWNDRLNGPTTETFLRFCRYLGSFSRKYWEKHYEKYPQYFYYLFIADVLPIPYYIRFPFPFFIGYPQNSLLIKWRYSIKGRPQHWALNCLIYELSQSGVKDKQIANLLRSKCPDMLWGFVKQYTENLGKDPLLTRINTIRKTMDKTVTSIFDVLIAEKCKKSAGPRRGRNCYV
jgi:hypothetical protein